MRMLFSQSTSDVWEKVTMSPMKFGQLCGHSCACVAWMDGWMDDGVSGWVGREGWAGRSDDWGKR